jgi:hypothetical protein
MNKISCQTSNPYDHHIKDYIQQKKNIFQSLK